MKPQTPARFEFDPILTLKSFKFLAFDHMSRLKLRNCAAFRFQFKLA